MSFHLQFFILNTLYCRLLGIIDGYCLSSVTDWAHAAYNCRGTHEFERMGRGLPGWRLTLPMLLVLLLACLTAFASASYTNEMEFRNIIKSMPPQKFLEFLQESTIQSHRISTVIDVICERGFGSKFLVAAFSKSPDTKRRYVMFLESSARHNRLDFLRFLTERGHGIFNDGTLLYEGTCAGHRGVVTFCCELGADPNGIYLGKIDAFLNRMIYRKIHQLLYYLIEEGVEIDRPDQLGKIIRNLEPNLREESLRLRNCEFAYSLLERTENLRHFAAVLSFGASFGIRMLIERLLEYPQVVWYLHLAKYATGVLFEKNEQLLRDYSWGSKNEGETDKRPRKLQSRSRRRLCDEFFKLIKRVEKKPSLVQPLTTQDLQPIIAQDSDMQFRFYVFMLGLAIDPEYAS